VLFPYNFKTNHIGSIIGTCILEQALTGRQTDEIGMDLNLRLYFKFNGYLPNTSIFTVFAKRCLKFKTNTYNVVIVL